MIMTLTMTIEYLYLAKMVSQFELVCTDFGCNNAMIIHDFTIDEFAATLCNFLGPANIFSTNLRVSGHIV